MREWILCGFTSCQFLQFDSDLICNIDPGPYLELQVKLRLTDIMQLQ
jgi:hypothetical protein